MPSLDQALSPCREAPVLKVTTDTLRVPIKLFVQTEGGGSIPLRAVPAWPAFAG